MSGSNTTLDPPNGLLLRVLRDGDGIFVKDTVGLRYGWGLTLGDAVRMWADCVMDVCDEENAGGSLLAEQRAYRQALAAPVTTQEPAPTDKAQRDSDEDDQWHGWEENA
jgi:hypothetical protein